MFSSSPDSISDPALPARRRSELVRLVRAQGQITVTEIATAFEVSADTIRRDLDALAEQGLLKRTHGGAVTVDPPVGADTPFELRLNRHKDVKTRVGRAAARLIKSGETLLVNGGTTTLAFAAELGGLTGLTVVTNNLRLPAALPPRAARDVYLLGGQVRAESQVTLGVVGFAGSGAISADTAVIGVAGVSSAGISTSMLAEAQMMAAMLAAARRTIVVVESAKFGRNAFAHIAPLTRLHVVVSEADPPGDLLAELNEAGVEMVRADAAA